LERIAASAQPVNSLNLTNTLAAAVEQQQQQQQTINTNANSTGSISRSVAANDAAHAALGQSPYLASNIVMHHLNNSTASNITNSNAATSQSSFSNTDSYFRCPICREAVIVPRGGVSNFPPSFIVNQLLDLIKNQRRDYVPLCKNHPHEELLFCETCDAAFCSLCESHCRVSSNADHIVIPFSIAIKRMSEIFYFKSNQCINSFNLALANVQREIDSLGGSVERVALAIDHSFDEIQAVIEARRITLLKTLAKIKDDKTKLLSEQVKLIVNEKQKVELECKEYHTSITSCNESKRLGSQIQQMNEKLDCLRSLCEPRENCFINYEYKFNDALKGVDTVLGQFGRFRTSSTYPPLCYAKIVDDYSSSSSSSSNATTNSVNTPGMSQYNGTSSSSLQVGPAAAVANDSIDLQHSASKCTYSANLAILVRIQTVDYYGRKRTEGGDPIIATVTDPYGAQETCHITDLNTGSYTFKLVPSLIGKYRLDISIFSRPINQMPLFFTTVPHIDSMWTFGAGFTGLGQTTATNKQQTTTPTSRNSLNMSFGNNRGTTDKDFNMPISVRCCGKLIYVLDSGNNRIKVLNLNGVFQRHIVHHGLAETSATALAFATTTATPPLDNDEPIIELVSLNWRLRLLSNYKIEFHENNNKESLTTHELKDSFDEPVGLMETFHPEIFIIQDKKKLCLCTHDGTLMYDSLDTKLRVECGLKNITSFTADLTSPSLYVADSLGPTIYQVSLDWLCNGELARLCDQFKLSKGAIHTVEIEEESLKTFRKFSNEVSSLNAMNRSTSQGSLVSNSSWINYSAGTGQTHVIPSQNLHNVSFSSGSASVKTSTSGSIAGGGGVYTALCYDAHTQKLLAAKSTDKQRTTIEIYNSSACSYEYSIESSQQEKALKRVTSMSCTKDGRVVCVDLCANLIKMFRFT
jgi:ribosomal protein S27E